jgi:hypothetical protein
MTAPVWRTANNCLHAEWRPEVQSGFLGLGDHDPTQKHSLPEEFERTSTESGPTSGTHLRHLQVTDDVKDEGLSRMRESTL